MLSAGQDLELIRPIRPDGRLSDKYHGTHRGKGSPFNIVNAVPGMHYYWARDDMLVRYLMDGWEIVPPESPERGMPEVDENYRKAVDSFIRRDNLILLRISEERYAELQALKGTRSQGALYGVTDAYLDSEQSHQLESRYGENAGGPIRFPTRGHGTRRATEAELR